jgi:hypothetical protein
LFAVRDCLTISGAFFVPAALAVALSSSGRMDENAAGGDEHIPTLPAASSARIYVLNPRFLT